MRVFAVLWLIVSLAVIVACSAAVDRFEPTVDMEGAILTVSLDTDLPDDAEINMSVARYFSVEGEGSPRPMTMSGAYGMTVGELRDGVAFDLSEEADQYRWDVRRRAYNNVHWAKVFALRLHHVAMIFAPDTGPLRGAAVGEGNDFVRAKTEFAWGKRETLSGTVETTEPATRKRIVAACEKAVKATERALARSGGLTDRETAWLIRDMITKELNLVDSWLDGLLKNCATFQHEIG